MDLLILPDGCVSAVYAEDIDLGVLGRSSFRRRQGIPIDQPSTRTDSIVPVCSSTLAG